MIVLWVSLLFQRSELSYIALSKRKKMIVKRGSKYHLISKKRMGDGGMIDGDPEKEGERRPMLFGAYPYVPEDEPMDISGLRDASIMTYVEAEPEDSYYQPERMNSMQPSSFDPGVNIGGLEFDDILERQMFQESRFNPLAESPAGARGLAQITPITEKELKRKGLVPENFDPFNAKQAVAAQRAYMSSLLDRSWVTGTDQVRMAKALAAYNAGPTRIYRILEEAKNKGYDVDNSLEWMTFLPSESRDYIQKVLLGENESFETQYAQGSIKSPMRNAR